MDIEILVDATSFWDRLQGDIAGARDRVWAQTLSFEGDSAGRRFADAMAACRAPNRRIIVDHYTRFWLSDRFLYRPRSLLDPALRAEAAATRRMFEGLGAAGVGVRFVSPLGFLMRRIAARNHKKLVLIDEDVAYLGGFNFAEHNFEWHDLMLRIEHAGVARFLAEDLRATWEGRTARARGRFEGLDLLSLDGTDNETVFADVLQLIAHAQRSVVLHNPYTTFPFWDALRTAAGRGARVTVIMPERNNRRFMREYMAWEGARSGIELRLYPGRMSHLKALLIDDRLLIAGSANFDWLAYTFQAEILLLIRRPEVIADFRAQVLEPDLAISTPAAVQADERSARRALRIMQACQRIARVIGPAAPSPAVAGKADLDPAPNAGLR